jgi:TonB family protein
LAWSNWREAVIAAGRPGVVVVRFTLTAEGIVEDVVFEKRSGSPILDAEAENAVRRARLPFFPSHWEHPAAAPHRAVRLRAQIEKR